MAVKRDVSLDSIALAARVVCARRRRPPKIVIEVHHANGGLELRIPNILGKVPYASSGLEHRALGVIVYFLSSNERGRRLRFRDDPLRFHNWFRRKLALALSPSFVVQDTAYDRAIRILEGTTSPTSAFGELCAGLHDEAGLTATEITELLGFLGIERTANRQRVQMRITRSKGRMERALDQFG